MAWLLWMANTMPPSYTLKRRPDEPQMTLQTDQLYGNLHYTPDSYFGDTPVLVVPGRPGPSIVPVPAFHFGPVNPLISSAVPLSSSCGTALEAPWSSSVIHAQSNQRGGGIPPNPRNGRRKPRRRGGKDKLKRTNDEVYRPSKRARTGAYESVEVMDDNERVKFTNVSVCGGTGGAGGGGGMRGGGGGTGTGPMFNFNFRST
ncbi:hypothetical protein K438DRAFT_1806119 [Mycena galopus ATCC 62051]|nr:hypothetical protein K438DRAFT_1806119 [Mycena galopus ATCC 62051]